MNKKYVLVTGASSGIGIEIAKNLNRSNYTPLLLGRNPERLNQTLKVLENPGSKTIVADVGEEEVTSKIQDVLKTLEDQGQLVGLVNNAGVYSPSSIEDSSESDWIKQYKINVLGPLYCVKACLSDLKKTKGSIVNISSTLGVRPVLNTASYSASKAALNNFTQSLALEYAKFGIRANTLCPGIVDTPIHSENQQKMKNWKEDLKNLQPLGRVGEVEDIAPLVTHLISENARWTTGSCFHVDGGILLNS